MPRAWHGADGRGSTPSARASLNPLRHCSLTDFGGGPHQDLGRGWQLLRPSTAGVHRVARFVILHLRHDGAGRVVAASGSNGSGGFAGALPTWCSGLHHKAQADAVAQPARPAAPGRNAPAYHSGFEHARAGRPARPAARLVQARWSVSPAAGLGRSGLAALPLLGAASACALYSAWARTSPTRVDPHQCQPASALFCWRQARQPCSGQRRAGPRQRRAACANRVRRAASAALSRWSILFILGRGLGPRDATYRATPCRPELWPKADAVVSLQQNATISTLATPFSLPSSHASVGDT